MYIIIVNDVFLCETFRILKAKLAIIRFFEVLFLYHVTPIPVKETKENVILNIINVRLNLICSFKNEN